MNVKENNNNTNGSFCIIILENEECKGNFILFTIN